MVYLDVAAEIEANLDTFAPYGDRARAAGAVVIPAVAFYGSLGDLLATAHGHPRDPQLHVAGSGAGTHESEPARHSSQVMAANAAASCGCSGAGTRADPRDRPLSESRSPAAHAAVADAEVRPLTVTRTEGLDAEVHALLAQAFTDDSVDAARDGVAALCGLALCWRAWWPASAAGPDLAPARLRPAPCGHHEGQPPHPRVVANAATLHKAA